MNLFSNLINYQKTVNNEKEAKQTKIWMLVFKKEFTRWLSSCLCKHSLLNGKNKVGKTSFFLLKQALSKTGKVESSASYVKKWSRILPSLLPPPGSHHFQEPITMSNAATALGSLLQETELLSDLKGALLLRLWLISGLSWSMALCICWEAHSAQ